jgi:glycosyltransferase involved in cell wall biosynthesis
MLGIVVRQSAVLEDRKPSLGKWREICILEGIQARGHECRLVCSSFDHYSMSQRKITQKKSFYKRIVLKSPGYSNTSSVLRIIDAWIFSIKLFRYLYRCRKQIDYVIVSFPTPESSFIVSLFTRYMKVYVDVRDAWPTVFNLKGPKNFLFSLYCKILFKITLKRCNGVIAMSHAMGKHALNYNKDINIEVIVNPIGEPNTEYVDMSGHPEYQSVKLQDNSFISFFFAGTLNQQFDFKIIHKASKILDEQNIKHQFLIAGDGKNYSMLSNKYNDSNLIFLGQLDKNICDEYAKICDGLFCFYKDKSFKGHLTNKLLDYIRFKKFIFHNLGNNFIINNRRVSIGYNIDTAEDLCFLVSKFIKNELIQNDIIDAILTRETFGRKITEFMNR